MCSANIVQGKQNYVQKMREPDIKIFSINAQWTLLNAMYNTYCLRYKPNLTETMRKKHLRWSKQFQELRHERRLGTCVVCWWIQHVNHERQLSILEAESNLGILITVSEGKSEIPCKNNGGEYGLQQRAWPSLKIIFTRL